MRQDRPPPAFTGLVVHREPRYQCSLLLPDGWERLDLESEHGSGVIFRPDPTDPQTSFSFEGRALGVEVSAADLSALQSGFLSGLRKMAGSRIESCEAEAIGRLITMEARHTYREGDALRQRWVRLLYQGEVQARLIAQGSSPEEFAHWEPMFFATMRTFRFGDWWAEVTGAAWTPTVFNEGEGTPEPGP